MSLIFLLLYSIRSKAFIPGRASTIKYLTLVINYHKVFLTKKYSTTAKYLTECLKIFFFIEFCLFIFFFVLLKSVIIMKFNQWKFILNCLKWSVSFIFVMSEKILDAYKVIIPFWLRMFLSEKENWNKCQIDCRAGNKTKINK